MLFWTVPMYQPNYELSSWKKSFWSQFMAQIESNGIHQWIQSVHFGEHRPIGFLHTSACGVISNLLLLVTKDMFYGSSTDDIQVIHLFLSFCRTFFWVTSSPSLPNKPYPPTTRLIISDILLSSQSNPCIKLFQMQRWSLLKTSLFNQNHTVMCHL